jgi:hypothetical protein
LRPKDPDALLSRARADVPEGTRAAFWDEAVRTDPTLVKISESPAMRTVAAEFKSDRP